MGTVCRSSPATPGRCSWLPFHAIHSSYDGPGLPECLSPAMYSPPSGRSIWSRAPRCSTLAPRYKGPCRAPGLGCPAADALRSAHNQALRNPGLNSRVRLSDANRRYAPFPECSACPELCRTAHSGEVQPRGQRTMAVFPLPRSPWEHDLFGQSHGCPSSGRKRRTADIQGRGLRSLPLLPCARYPQPYEGL